MFDPNTGQDDGTDAGSDWGHFYDHPGEAVPITADMVKQLYARFMPGYNPSDAEIQAAMHHPGGVQGLSKDFESQYGPGQAPAQPTAPPPSGGGGGGGQPGGDLFPPYAPYVAPTPGALPSAPGFTAPPAFQFENFKPPSIEDARSNPLYAGQQFATQEGEQALNQAAAAKGTLRTGGTLKDFINYGQKAGDQYYQNVLQNAAQQWQMNYGNAKDQYMSRYQSALDEFAPKEQEYLTGTNATLTQNQNNAANAWAAWYGQNGLDLNRRNSIFSGAAGLTG